MPALDRSRPARMALALFGLAGAGVLGVILGVVREAGWLSLIFALAFALALLLEIAGGWQETTRPSRRRLLQTFSFALGIIIFAAVAYREGWEAVLFLLMFLAIWQLATIWPAGNFLPPLPAAVDGSRSWLSASCARCQSAGADGATPLPPGLNFANLPRLLAQSPNR
jgi:hypothetical protein